MARAPFNVLVIPFLRQTGGPDLFCPLLRADGGYWQWIAGGGESAESSREAARRETLEESGLMGAIYPLSSISSVPGNVFAARRHWPKDLYVIPVYTFAIEATSREIQLSHEHTAHQWADYKHSYELLHWQSDQAALWELSQRLQDNQMPQPF